MAEENSLTDLADQIEKSWLKSNYCLMGRYLLKAREEKHWSRLGFRNFSSYLISMQKHFRIGRTQLYTFIGVAEKLLPFVCEDQLLTMGVAKAWELHKMVVSTQAKPSRKMIELALHPTSTIKDVRAAVYQILSKNTTVVSLLETNKKQESFIVRYCRKCGKRRVFYKHPEQCKVCAAKERSFTDEKIPTPKAAPLKPLQESEIVNNYRTRARNCMPVDEHAEVRIFDEGAYVQAWLWVNKE